MLAELSCDRGNWFDAVCRGVEPHDPTGLAGPLVERLISSIAIFIAVYLGGRVIRRGVIAALGRASADRQVRTLARNLITATTYVVALLSALVVAGVNFALLVTAAGVGTVAIGLAFQDVLRNVLAGIWLLLEQPFRLGDSIVVADQSGIVQNITLRTTTLRTGDGQLALLPNLVVFSSAVVNNSKYELRRFTVSVRLPADANLERALSDARGVLGEVEEIAARPPFSLQPQLDGEAMVLHCHFWIDQRGNDADSVVAAVAAKLGSLGRRPRPQRKSADG